MHRRISRRRLVPEVFEFQPRRLLPITRYLQRIAYCWANLAAYTARGTVVVEILNSPISRYVRASTPVVRGCEINGENKEANGIISKTLAAIREVISVRRSFNHSAVATAADGRRRRRCAYFMIMMTTTNGKTYRCPLPRKLALMDM